MTVRGTTAGAHLLVLAGLLMITAPASAQHAGGHPGAAPAPRASPGPGGAHQHLDTRFSHNQYYYDHGYSVPHHPSDGRGEFHGRDGGRYWFHGGNWYRWHRGGGWVVWGPPIGVFVPLLPPVYTTVWWYGVPYYYANDTYYQWDADREEYEVVAPPEGMENAQVSPAPPPDQLFVYPKNGQSKDQQSKDDYECHRWAVAQTGFDPTASANGPPEGLADRRARYLRSKTACLEGRGYSVE